MSSFHAPLAPRWASWRPPLRDMATHTCTPAKLCRYCKVHTAIAHGDPRDASLLRYFASLPRAALERLYTNGWAVQGILRALPSLSRIYALRLVTLSAVGVGLPKEVVDGWARPAAASQAKHFEAIKALEQLGLIADVAAAAGDGSSGSASSKEIRLRQDFATQLLDCIRVGGVMAVESECTACAAASSAAAATTADMTAAAGGATAPVAVAPHTVLEKHALTQWEELLGVVMHPPREEVKLAMPCEDATYTTLQELLLEADLLRTATEADLSNVTEADVVPAGSESRRVMSPDAARFLLLPTHAQVWRLVRAYMELAETGTKGTRHATLCFLMRLGQLELGIGHRMDDPSLDEGQRAALADMALLGLAYIPPDDGKTYYATPLAQYLLSAASGGSSSGAAASTATAAVSGSNPSAPGDGGAGGVGGSSLQGDGFIVLETNFRLYAYTSSALWSQVHPHPHPHPHTLTLTLTLDRCAIVAGAPPFY